MTRRSTFWLLASIMLASSSAAQETAGDGRLTADHILDWERVRDPQI